MQAQVLALLGSSLVVGMKAAIAVSGVDLKVEITLWAEAPPVRVKAVIVA
jgi:hypothetical protein